MPPPAPRPGASSPPTPRLARVAGLAVVLVAAAALRAFPAPAVFTPDGVQVTGDDDPLYHLLQAERLLDGTPGAPWRDPSLNYPQGALVPWPPLFDALIAGTARVLAPGGPVPRETVARVGAVLPVALALVTLVVVFLLAETIVAGTGLPAALVVGLLPAHAVFSMVGRADQHVLELLVSSLAFLAVLRGLVDPRAPSGRLRALLAVSLAAAAWTWLGSSLYPLFLVALAGLLFVLRPGDASRRLAGDLAAGAGGAAVLVASTLVATRGVHALREATLAGLSAFQVATLALAAAFGAAVAACHRAPRLAASPARRATAVATAAAVPLGALLLWPGFRDAVRRGLEALARGNAWYANIEEFDPLLLAGFRPLSRELRDAVGLYGLTLLAMPIAGLLLLRRLRREPGRAAPLLFVAVWGGAFLALGVARQRFALYLVVPLAIWLAVAARDLSGALVPRVGARGARALEALAFAALLAPALVQVPDTLAGEAPRHAAIRALLARVAALPTPPDRPAIFAEWPFGHLVQYVTGRPTLVSPFGTEGGEGAMEDSARLFLADDEAIAADVLARRRVGVVVLGDPITEAHFALPFAPAGTAPAVVLERSPWTGVRVSVLPRYRDLVAVRLFHADGGVLPGAPALGGFRLLDEVADARGAPLFKAFGPVPGAIVRVLGAPGAAATLEVAVASPTGRRFAWRTAAAVVDGEATLRVPYATGPNGRSAAGPAVVRVDGAALAEVRISEEDVERGAILAVAPRSATRGAARPR